MWRCCCEMIQILEAQLAAGRGNVVALLATKCRRHTMALQDAEKGFLHCRGGTFPIETSDLIVRNEVNFCPQAARMADEAARLVLRVIEALNENILESEELTLTRAIIFASIQ